MRKSTNFDETIEYFVHNSISMINREIEVPKINFVFNEDALKYFNYLKKYSITNRLFVPAIEDKDIELLLQMKNNYDYPRIVVHDYKTFFSYLMQISNSLCIEKERYCESPDMNNIQYWLFMRIWLRMTPSDFLNVENFLKEQFLFSIDKTFDEYFNLNNSIGNFMDYNIKTHLGLGQTYDESMRYMEFRLVKGDNYFELPVIRYDIKNGTTCIVTAIQSRNIKNISKENEEELRSYFSSLNRYISEKRKDDYNKNCYPYNTRHIYPGSLISLIFFTNMLISKKIDKIKVPCIHVLSYDYHKIIEKQATEDWEKYKNMDPNNIIWPYNYRYQNAKRWFEKNYQKQDFISKAKTEELLKLFYRLSFHYNFINIQNEPMIEDEYLNLKIDPVKLDDIGPKFLTDIYLETQKVMKKI